MANGYKKISAAYPGMSDKDIFKKIVVVRYSFMGENHYLDSISKMIDNNEIDNICKLVMSIISHESKDFEDMPLSYKAEILSAVAEILYKQKVINPSAASNT